MRMFARNSLIVFTVLLYFTSGAAIAKPELKEETLYYQVSGDNAEALRQQINSRSSAQQDGRTYGAYTRWNVRWHYDWATTDSYCSMTTVTTQVDVTYTLPQWVDRKAAPAQLQKKWDRYYNALIDHEHGHKEFGLKAAKAIELALSGMGHESCDRLQHDANSKGNKILDKYIAREKQYDIKTRHGMNDGAVFP